MSEPKPKSEKQRAAWAAYNASRHPHPAFPLGMDAGIKHCTACCEDKPVEEFPKATRNAGGLHSWCRPCFNASARRSRDANLAKHRAREDAWMAERQGWLVSLKDAPCTDCGGRFPSYCMDFDHVRGIKVASVSAMLNRSASRERILAEIAKCELVCANCHRIRTFGRGQHRPDLLSEEKA